MMTWFDKAQPFLVLVSVFVGLILGQVVWLSKLASSAIAPLLALMLYGTFLPLPLKHFGRGLKNSKVALASFDIK